MSYNTTFWINQCRSSPFLLVTSARLTWSDKLCIAIRASEFLKLHMDVCEMSADLCMQRKKWITDCGKNR